MLNSLSPTFADEWHAMLTAVDLNPDDASLDPARPVGIGNPAGLAAVAAREDDGMNQLGNRVNRGGEVYRIWQYITPQFALTKPYSYSTPRVFHAPRPAGGSSAPTP